MTSNLYLRRFSSAASPLALGVALVVTAVPAAAQETQSPATAPPAPAPVITGAASQDTAAAPVADPNEANDDQVVVVRGFRAALQTAVNKKKNSDQVVESVSAEDIGKLPDASIGESIARLPGVTSQRTNGRASGIAIRGFGPDFSTTLLNGREQTSTNDSRGVEFDQYPSEIVSRVDIYKTPSAALVGQGLVGTIDIRTARPLDYSKPVIAVGARASYDDIGKRAGFPKYGKRFNGTFIDQFADKRVGIALSASYLDEVYPNQQFNAWGYAGSGTAASPYLIGGSKSFVTTTRLKRYGLNGTLQFKPTETLTFTADGFYSHFNDDGNLKGIELPLGFGGGFNTTGPVNTTVSNNVVTSGVFPNVYGVVRNDIFQRKAKLYSGGLNLTWNPGTAWSGFLDYVSRALSGNPAVSAETRARVFAAAEQLNYKVDKNASGLRRQQARTLAALFFEDPTPDDTLINPFYLSMLGSMVRACAAHGYDLLISFQQLSDDWHVDYEDSRKADGIILLGYGDYTLHRPRLEQLVRHGTHFICWGNPRAAEFGAVVGCDNEQGGFDATRHLLDAGRRRIAFIGTATEAYPEFLERHRGYLRAHRETGLAVDPMLRVSAGPSEAEGRAALAELQRRGPLPDGLFASSDLAAIGAMHALQEQGIAVPRDVSVVGFDDLATAGYANPPLTTVAQDARAAGKALVEGLIATIEGRGAESRLLPGRLKVRGSSLP